MMLCDGSWSERAVGSSWASSKLINGMISAARSPSPGTSSPRSLPFAIPSGLDASGDKGRRIREKEGGANERLVHEPAVLDLAGY